MTDYTRVENDTGPPIRDQLQTDGSPDDITGADVTFTLWEPRNGTLIEKDNSGVVIRDSTTGKVSYEFASGDLDQIGVFYYEWEVTFVDGEVVTYRDKNSNPRELEVVPEGA